MSSNPISLRSFRNLSSIKSSILISCHVQYCTQRTKLLMCTTFSGSNVKPCHGFEHSALARKSCVLDTHTRMGVCVPTPHAHACTQLPTTVTSPAVLLLH